MLTNGTQTSIKVNIGPIELHVFLFELKISWLELEHGSEFSSYKIEFWNQVMQMMSLFELLTRKFLWRFFFRVTNSPSQNIKFYLELLTRELKSYFSAFKLLTRSWKIKSFNSRYELEAEKIVPLQVTNSMGKLLHFHFWVTSSKFKNKTFFFELLIRKMRNKILISNTLEISLLKWNIIQFRIIWKKFRLVRFCNFRYRSCSQMCCLWSWDLSAHPLPYYVFLK